MDSGIDLMGHSKAAAGKLNLLVVDHVANLRHLTVGLLRGLEVGSTQMASSAPEALQMMKLKRPDAVLAEWAMPNMDGLEMLQAMRDDPALADIPLVLVTSDVERSLVQRAVSAGVADLLVKPFTLQRLEDKVRGAVRRGAPPVLSNPPLTAPEQSAAPARRPVVLVVDDTPDNLRLMVDLFSDQYQVKVADNGQKALDICAGAVPPDLVLLDVMMPGMDGFEVARRLREQANGELMPVVFVTALSDGEAQMRGLDLGAVDFVSKPIDPDVIKMRVRNFIRYIDLHKRRQQEFDAMLAQARQQQELARQLREEVDAPLGEALAALRGLQGLDETQRAAIARIELALGRAQEAVGKCAPG